MTDNQIPPAVLKVLDKFAHYCSFSSWKGYKEAGGEYKDFEQLATLAFKAGREFERKQAEPQEPPDKGDMDGRER